MVTKLSFPVYYIAIAMVHAQDLIEMVGLTRYAVNRISAYTSRESVPLFTLFRCLVEYVYKHQLTQEVLAVYAKTKFSLSVVPSSMTFSRVLNNHVSASDSNSARKIKYHFASPELEERLLLWIRQCEQYKLPIVTGAIIRAKADKIRRELIISTPDESAKLNALVFLPGWLSKFQSRNRLTSKRVHGKAASVSRAAVEKGGAALQELTRGYERHNVFNMDETAFFFCTPTTKTISTQRHTASDTNSTVSSMPPGHSFHLLWRKAFSSGQFSVEKLCMLRDYCCRCDLWDAIAGCCIGPIVWWLLVITCELIPLADPSHTRMSDQIGYFVRTGYEIFLISWGGLYFFFELNPDIEVYFSIRIAATLVETAFGLFSLALLTAFVGFPVPFAPTLTIFPVMTAQMIIFGAFIWRKAASPEQRHLVDRLNRFYTLTVAFASPVFLYVAYLCLIENFSERQQFFISGLLPIIKSAIRQLISRKASPVMMDASPLLISATSQCFHDVFSVACLQNANAFFFYGLLLGNTMVGFFCIAMAEQDCNEIRKQFQLLSTHMHLNKNAPKEDLEHGRMELLQRTIRLVHSVTFEPTDEILGMIRDADQVPVNHRFPIFTSFALYARSSVFGVSRYQHQVPKENFRLCSSIIRNEMIPLDTWKQRISDFVSCLRKRKIHDSAVVGPTLLKTGLVGPTLLKTGIVGPPPVFKSDQLHVEPLNLCRGESLSQVKRGDNITLETISKTLTMLHRMEHNCLRMYTSSTTLLGYLVYLSIAVHLPSRAYNTALASLLTKSDDGHVEIDSARLTTVLSHLSVCAVGQVTMLIIYWWRVGKRIQISQLHHLGFVLETQWTVGFFVFVSAILFPSSYPIQHNGYDFTFRFSWLTPSDKIS
uniref:AlNc14C61G4455 protein n=1 Tax=Albugo laibachii Nc14 TaxID=890382 RepID=F0WCS9_9STRA|nr:AlNc14C61G4455 [Albugo laibachii Nc14]|eukprot:CCA18998.1 AlNc14C61G4455 [Albugo laibachii Nc14]